MGDFIQPGDLTMFAVIDQAKAEAMIEDAEAMVVLVAPCLAGLAADDTKRPAVKAILRGALLRWNEAGSGAFTQAQEVTGPFTLGQSFDTRVQRKSMFWPSEIEQLQGLCADGATGKAFSVDTLSSSSVVHAPWCALVLGATYCSCGADLTLGLPLYEVD